MSKRNNVKTAGIAAVAAFLLAGCNSSGGGSQGGAPVTHDTSEIVSALHLKTDDGVSYNYVGPKGLTCEIAVVLTDKPEVDLYAGAGDVVAKNAAGTAGVKIVTAEEKSCLTALTKALKAVH